MKLFVKRHRTTDDATGGLLMVDGSAFGFTCEDEPREEKVSGETRIPAGIYKIILRNEGGMTKRYAKRFPDFHRGMLHLQDVPGFEWIYIHVGNKESHTDGCILVGFGADWSGDPTVSKSTQAYTELYKMCMEAFDNDESVYIEIKD